MIPFRHVVDDARASLVSAKAQVEMWKSKVDRGCIERLKAFTNPPVLVAQVNCLPQAETYHPMGCISESEKAPNLRETKIFCNT